MASCFISSEVAFATPACRAGSCRISKPGNLFRTFAICRLPLPWMAKTQPEMFHSLDPLSTLVRAVLQRLSQ